MVIHYLDIKSIGVDPTEADPPLVVDPNAVLPGPIAGFLRLRGLLMRATPRFR